MKTKRIKQPKQTTTAIAVTPEYIETLKYQRWVEAFLNKDDPETYGNATKSALKVYRSSSYNVAAQIGFQNLKKYKNDDSRNFSFA